MGVSLGIAFIVAPTLTLNSELKCAESAGKQINNMQSWRKMKPETLTDFRKRLGLSQTKFAVQLGISRRTLGQYEKGLSDIPIHIALACAALAFGLPPMGEPSDLSSFLRGVADFPLDEAVKRLSAIMEAKK